MRQRKESNFEEPPMIGGITKDILDRVIRLRDEHDRNLGLVTTFCTIFDNDNEGVGVRAMHEFVFS